MALTIPSQILHLATTARRGALRQPIAWIVLILSSLLLVASPYFVVFGFGREEALLRDTCLATVTLMGAVLVVLLAAEGVPTGRGGREPALPLTAPAPRHALVLGRYLGLLQVLGASHLVLSIVAALTLASHGDRIPSGLFPGLVFAFAAVAVLLAIAVAISTRAGLPAIGLGTFTFLALGQLSPIVHETWGASPNALVRTATWCYRLFVPDLSLLDGTPLLTNSAASAAQPGIHLLATLAYAGLYAAGVLALATALRERRPLR